MLHRKSNYRLIYLSGGDGDSLSISELNFLSHSSQSSLETLRVAVQARCKLLAATCNYSSIKLNLNMDLIEKKIHPTRLTAVVSEEIKPSFVLEFPRRWRAADKSSSSAVPPPYCEN